MKRENEPSWVRRNFPLLSLAWIVDFILWLGKAALDKVTDKPSMTQIVALMAATSMCIGTLALLLSKARYVWFNGGDVSWELIAVTTPLCVLAGFNYKTNSDERVKVEAAAATPDKPTGATE